MSVVFNQDTYVWVPDDTDYMVPAKVVSKFEKGKVGQVKLLVDGKEPRGAKPVRVDAGDSERVERMDEQSLTPIDDMVTLKNLNEASILYNLKLRYDKDAIYTRVSKILIALNPFKLLPIYSPQVMDEYLSQGSRDMDPHIYGTADDAFRAMQVNKRDQSCIVSGESGAGKTETTKLFLEYVAQKSIREASADGGGKGKSKRRQQKAAASGGSDESLQHKVLEANPLMEAFGNAKTVRNDNSSRFGKWIEIQFEGLGRVVGGRITNYLLEKSRLVTQGEGERNYHIFYQLCAAAVTEPELKKKFHLSDASQYHYLNQSKRSSISIDGVDDADGWRSTRMAMEVVAISDEDVDQIVQLLSGILHLGNITMESSGGEASKVSNKDMLELAAEQLRVPAEDLDKALTKRKIKAGRDVTWGDNSKAKATEARDALAKQVYTVLFDWLITRINESLGQSGAKDLRVIGVLDIFGFETFEVNSFEQLCINYCNEKLQGHFNDHIFALEQAEYKREGVNVDKIEFNDNSAVIALIDAGKGAGILSLVQEELKSGRNQDDMKLREKVLAMAPKSDGKISEPNPKDVKARSHLKTCFVFVHYAGPVEYDVTGFIEKNADILQLALYELGMGSKSKLLASLFKSGVDQDDKKKPLGIQFRDQLKDLMDRLGGTEPHFVRCIKPNSDKAGNRFRSGMVLSQLRYAGVLEVCRIRKLGYPVRKEFGPFVTRYRPLAGDKSKSVKAGDATGLCKMLEDRDVLFKDEYQVGKNKVFMRDDQFDQLEATLEKTLTQFVLRAQAVARRFIARTRLKKWLALLDTVRVALKKKDIDALEAALLGVGGLPYGGRHLPDVQNAQEQVAVLKEERRVLGLLEAAIESKDLAEIQSALKAAEKMNLGNHGLAKEARDAIKKIKEERKVRDQLRAAVDVGTSIAALEDALAKARAAKITNIVEARDAEALLKRLQREASLRADLTKAVAAKNATNAKALMNELVSLGVGKADPLVEQAVALVKEEAQASHEREVGQMRLLGELEKAVASKNLNALNDLEVEVIAIGLEDHELVKEAMALRKRLQGMEESASVLAAETRAVQYKAQSAEGVTTKDLDGLSVALSAAIKEGVDAKETVHVKEAEALLQRLEKQMEVQRDLDGLVKRIDTAKGGKEKAKEAARTELQAALASAQQLGMDTASARKVKFWVQDLERADAEQNKAMLATTRQQNLERLKEATKDDLEEQAMQRLAKLTSQAHKDRLAEAADDAVYDLKKFYRLRTNDDFTADLPEEERALAAKLKLWSRAKPIPKSLLQLSDEQNRTALRVNRAILQYCGDMTTSFPATLAQYILVKGLEDDQMCDEIYTQLCKHIFANPKPESADRTWLLMCMSTKTFPPTTPFTLYLLNFLLKHKNLSGLQGNYARLCLVQLDATIDLGASVFKPNLEEIQSYRRRPPVLATIKMVSGEQVDYPISPDLRIAQVLEMIQRQEGIEDDPERPSFGIFVRDARSTSKVSPRQRLVNFYQEYNKDKLKHVDLFLEHWKGNEEELFAKLVEKYGPEPAESTPGKKAGILSASVTGALHAAKMLGLTSGRRVPPAPKTGWPLPWWSHAGDVYLRMTAQGKQPVFEFKRRLFLPNMEAPDKLLYMQLLGDIQSGDLAINAEEQVAELALIAVTLNSPKLKPPKPDKLPEAGLVKYMSPDWRRKRSPDSWARVAAAVAQLPRTEPKLYERFAEICKDSPVYGMTFFAGRQADKPEDLTIGVNAAGVSFVERSQDGRATITETFPYARVSKYGASSEYFWMSYSDAKAKGKGAATNILLYTLQSWELYEVVFDYTHAPQ